MKQVPPTRTTSLRRKSTGSFTGEKRPMLRASAWGSRRRDYLTMGPCPMSGSSRS
jgi:hypothetical protein